MTHRYKDTRETSHTWRRDGDAERCPRAFSIFYRQHQFGTERCTAVHRANKFEPPFGSRICKRDPIVFVCGPNLGGGVIVGVVVCSDSPALGDRCLNIDIITTMHHRSSLFIVMGERWRTCRSVSVVRGAGKCKFNSRQSFLNHTTPHAYAGMRKREREGKGVVYPRIASRNPLCYWIWGIALKVRCMPPAKIDMLVLYWGTGWVLPKHSNVAVWTSGPCWFWWCVCVCVWCGDSPTTTRRGWERRTSMMWSVRQALRMHEYVWWLCVCLSVSVYSTMFESAPAMHIGGRHAYKCIYCQWPGEPVSRTSVRLCVYVCLCSWLTRCGFIITGAMRARCLAGRLTMCDKRVDGERHLCGQILVKDA